VKRASAKENILQLFFDGVEDADHFLLNCHDFTHIRNTLMSNVSQTLNLDFLSFTPKKIKIGQMGRQKYKIVNFEANDASEVL
jgi:hypothetical protein